MVVYLFISIFCLTSQVDTSTLSNKGDRTINGNVIFNEFLGGNFNVSINYERSLFRSNYFFCNARLGLGTLLLLWSSTYSVSCNDGGHNNFFESGFGRTNYLVGLPGVYFNNPSHYYYPYIGYRYQKRFVFKFYILKIIGHYNNQIVGNIHKDGQIVGQSDGNILSIGLAFGFAF